MVLGVPAFVMGALVVVGTMLSAIRIVVVPRGQPVALGWLVFQVVRVPFALRAKRARSYEARDRVMALYAPVALLSLPIVWMTLVMAGYAAMFWAVGERPWSLALETSGSSLLTLGFVRPERPLSIVLAFSEAGLAIAVLALLLVTYLPSMYTAFGRRELAVSLLEVRAGSPPSGIDMLRRVYTIGRMELVAGVFRTWEEWFADIEETHTSLSAICFFRSPQPEHSWVTAAGAVLDAAALMISAVDIAEAIPGNPGGPRMPEAATCIRAGYLALRRIATFFKIPFDPDPAPDGPIAIAREEFDQAYDQLAAAGVPMHPDRDEAWRAFAGWRVNYDAPLLGLAQLTMAPYALWSSDRSPTYTRTRKLARWSSSARS